MNMLFTQEIAKPRASSLFCLDETTFRKVVFEVTGGTESEIFSLWALSTFDRNLALNLGQNMVMLKFVIARMAADGVSRLTKQSPRSRGNLAP